MATNDQDQNQNRLHPDNCNKAKCKTCIFGAEPLWLSEDRKAEIYRYLSTFEYSHICHTTDKTCYGALEHQAQLLYRMRIIEQPTVAAMLAAALILLQLPEEKPSRRTLPLDPEKPSRKKRP